MREEKWGTEPIRGPQRPMSRPVRRGGRPGADTNPIFNPGGGIDHLETVIAMSKVVCRMTQPSILYLIIHPLRKIFCRSFTYSAGM